MDKDLAEQVADIAHRVVPSGAISANGQFPGPGRSGRDPAGPASGGLAAGHGLRNPRDRARL